MVNPLYTSDQLPTTSAQAIREFDDRYVAALGASKANGWADTLGALVPTPSPWVTFPVGQLRTKYQRTEGSDGRAKTLLEKSFDVKSEEFDDGYDAKLMDLFLQVFAYRQWSQAPGRFVTAEEAFRHKQIALLLEDGVNQNCVDGKKFFATNHPANLFDTSAGSYSNYQATPTDCLDISKLEDEVAAMQDGVLDENGDKMGANPDTILVGYGKYEKLKNKLAWGMILGAASTATSNGGVTNPYADGRFNVIPVREFTDADDFMLVDSKLAAAGLSPWVILRQTVPSALALRIFDEASDFFKKTGRLRIESHIWYGFSLGLPHAIRLVKGA